MSSEVELACLRYAHPLRHRASAPAPKIPILIGVASLSPFYVAADIGARSLFVFIQMENMIAKVGKAAECLRGRYEVFCSLRLFPLTI